MADDGAISKMGSEHLCDAIGYVWKSTILHMNTVVPRHILGVSEFGIP